MTPQTTSCSRLAPVARTPSTGPLSMDSTASENSLASTPPVLSASAMTPANGPRPTATMNRVPTTRSGIERSRFISSRIGCCSQSGETLREQARPKGMAISTASVGAPHGDLDRQPHLGDVEPPVGEVRLQELRAELAHVLGVGEQPRRSGPSPPA